MSRTSHIDAMLWLARQAPTGALRTSAVAKVRRTYGLSEDELKKRLQKLNIPTISALAHPMESEYDKYERRVAVMTASECFYGRDRANAKIMAAVAALTDNLIVENLRQQNRYMTIPQVAHLLNIEVRIFKEILDCFRPLPVRYDGMIRRGDLQKFVKGPLAFLVRSWANTRRLRPKQVR